MLNMAQTAVLLGLAEHDIPVLVRAGLLQPLGNPPANAVKHFATLQVMELAGEITQLGRIRNAGSMNIGEPRMPTRLPWRPNRVVYTRASGDMHCWLLPDHRTIPEIGRTIIG
jgi:hypothetical protein